VFPRKRASRNTFLLIAPTAKKKLSAHKISRKSDIFCDLCKKDNFGCSYIASPGTFIFFTQPKKTVLFSQNFVCEHNISGCTPRIFRHFKIHLKCIFHNRCIWNYDPKHHVQQVENIVCPCTCVLYKPFTFCRST
jgi:hypothetical protein